MSQVVFIFPGQHTKSIVTEVIPRAGDYVSVDDTKREVIKVTCVYGKSGHHYRVHLGR